MLKRNKGLLTLSLVSLLCLGAADNTTYKTSKTLVLTDKNTVSLALPITGKTAAEVQQELMRLDRMNDEKGPIYLVLNSPGGSIDDGLKIAATAAGLRRKVHTIQIFSASMSFVLAQLLNTRYVLPNSTLMSHPASVTGIGGNIPGNFATRANAVIASLDEINGIVAVRANLDPIEYSKLIEKELWMQGKESVTRHFADELVTVRCDDSLKGAAEPRKIDLGFFGEVAVVFDKCPMITEPLEAKAGNGLINLRDFRIQLDAAGGSRLELR